MNNKETVAELMERMKKELMVMNVHEVLECWYDLKDELIEKGLM